MAKPLHDENAIESCNFAVVFERPFSDDEIQSLFGLEQDFKNEFTSFEKLNSFHVNLDSSRSESSHGVTGMIGCGGVLLQSFQDNGRRDWGIKVSENAIVVSCYNYDSWVTESEKAIRYIQSCGTPVDGKSNPVVMLVLHTTDHFLHDEEESQNYLIDEVFNRTSEYLTQHATKSGPLWHVFQGWFEDVEEYNAQCLHVLNLSTTQLSGQLLSVIDHAAQLQYTQPMPFDSVMANISSALGALHDRNKTILEQTLSDKQKRAIGL